MIVAHLVPAHMLWVRRISYGSLHLHGSQYFGVDPYRFSAKFLMIGFSYIIVKKKILTYKHTVSNAAANQTPKACQAAHKASVSKTTACYNRLWRNSDSGPRDRETPFDASTNWIWDPRLWKTGGFARHCLPKPSLEWWSLRRTRVPWHLKFEHISLKLRL